jgi:hypothetical protein
MGYEATVTDIKTVSQAVMVKLQGSSGVSTRSSETEWPENQVKVARTGP